MKKTYKLLLLAPYFLPLVTLAQSDDLEGVIGTVTRLLGSVIPIIFTIALIYFLWGLTQYIGGDVSKKEVGRDIMIYGVIALFVMSAVWGLVAIVANTVGITG